MFKNHTNRFGVACIWLDERMGTQRDITSPLKPPLTHKQAQKTHICMQSSKHTYEQRMLEEAGEQASRPVHAARRKVRQANRQAGRLEYVRCCAAAQTKKTYSSSPQQKKAYNKPSPHHRNIKAKETQPLHTCTAHDTT